MIKTHPDYMDLGAGDAAMDRYPVELYYRVSRPYPITPCRPVLAHPSEVARYWQGLRPLGVRSANTIPASATLCASCREAHEAGWLTHYPSEESQLRECGSR